MWKGDVIIRDVDVSMPCGSTRGFHVSPANGIFRGPYGPIEKCHVAPPGDTMWHHPGSAMCQYDSDRENHIRIQEGISVGAMWPNHWATCGIPQMLNVGP